LYVRLDLRKVINSFPLSTIAKIVTSVAMAVHGLPGLNDANAYDTVLGGYVGNFWNLHADDNSQQRGGECSEPELHSESEPTPTLTETGELPSGVTFKDNGNGTATLGGTPSSRNADLSEGPP
jgi:hypothetical protein